MELGEIKELLEAGLGDSKVDVSGDGHSLDIRVVGAVFEGLNKVKRQQKVYSILRELIASGELHAVTMQTYTPTEMES